MKRTLFGSGALAVALIAGGGAHAQTTLEPLKPSMRPELRKLNLKPDLVIRKLRLKSTGPCKSRSAVFTFEAVIANRGSAPAPALGGAAIIRVAENDGAGPWAGGARLKHPIPPGGEAAVTVPVYYLQSDPGHMVSGAPHRFRAIADPLKRIAEQKENNNRSVTVQVKAPPGCPVADRKVIGKLDRPVIGKDRDPRRLPNAPDRLVLVRPDLAVGAVHVAQGCELDKVALRIFNIGNGGVPESAWRAADGPEIRIRLDGQPWGRLPLAEADPEKRLKRPRSRARGHEVSLPARTLEPGSHRVIVTVDSNNAVAESNENNNASGERVFCAVEPDGDVSLSGDDQ